jgi:AMMECR1 domain-containing protein
VKNPDELANVQIRVDIIKPEGRRVLWNVSELDTKREGIILLSQTKNAIWVLLPNITNVASTADEYFQIVCKKAGLDSHELKPEDMVLYGIESTVFSDL